MLDWQAVFFDFDGVILDSVDVKTQAFTQMFSSYGSEILEAVVHYHLDNGGISRYDKFRYYYERLLKEPVSESKLKELGHRFSELVVKKVLESPYIPGAKESLQVLRANNIPSYLISGTPEEEILYIVHQKGLSDYFEEIHGAPKKKWKITADILSDRSFDSNKCLFIGDALSDYEAAKYNQMHFLGIVAESTNSIFPVGTKTSSKVKL